ncbi:MAG: ATP-binding protein [Methanothrix sp.]|nr:ATP-binding protein [Methanothrix sp.]
MDRDSILLLIAELRRRHGELEGVEAKAAHTGTPADLFKPLSAFANRPGGGVLLFGLDEDAGFKVVGVGNPRKPQEDLSGLAAQMEPPLNIPHVHTGELPGDRVLRAVFLLSQPFDPPDIGEELADLLRYVLAILLGHESSSIAAMK